MISIGHSHGRKWTESDIEFEIRKVMSVLGLKNRFPTHSEILEYTGNRGLNNAISKHGGTKYWASKIGCSIKNCESELGDYFEAFAIEDILKNTNLNSIKMKVRYPYDILVNSFIKVDVKASRINVRNENNKYHSFNLQKKDPTCDIFILYCIDNNDMIYKTYVIPSCKVAWQTQISITTNEITKKWDCYKDAWFYFDKYDSFYSEIIKGNK